MGGVQIFDAETYDDFNWAVARTCCVVYGYYGFFNYSAVTTGIMGIGLLYANTQHRRMSEIMVSEIEHIDTETEEEPLRNEGYRLAAGFALGFINLGKGSDLQGLHDMRLTERLLALAAGSKKVDLVHVFDKATAAAVMAIALIFMKSENQVLARKIDIPDSLLQFDYVRPDIFLLRTLAKNLILWSKIEPTFAWITRSLPSAYRPRSSLEKVKFLISDDLPFYDILAGLCFSIGLRFAGSGSFVVRDLLIHYLDQLMRICRINADTYDKKLTRGTVRTCQDLVALSLATVMAASDTHWNIVLDLAQNQTHIASFKSTQTVYVRRRPAHDASTSPFTSTLQALNDATPSSAHSLQWLFRLPAFASLSKAEQALVLPPDQGGAKCDGGEWEARSPAGIEVAV
ncbi:putative Negative regulator of mitosis [Glarea lozoyensis 74030]|uniref:Putative Negative regulator of mitosis n=1 Tax=Glarea lozoyensis (strain ATCC 74030 / MF5533) TaxID=1104152 RepID=H0EFP9_GLAL7|nr:putative Negative regulator of mitosis [Glarea lozoyensis 74030]